MLLGFSGSNAYVLLISLIVAEVTPHVSISQMSHAIEVQLKKIEDQLQRLRRREQQLLKQQERCSEDPEYPEYRRERINEYALAILGYIREEEQQLQEHGRQLRQLQGRLQEQLLRTAAAANCNGGCSRNRHREERLAQLLQKQEERQQQKQQQQRGTKRKLWRNRSRSTSSSSSDEGSKSDGGAQSDNPTAESAGGDVPNGDLANFVTLVDALLSDLRSVGLSDGGDASRDDLSTPYVHAQE